MRYGFIIFTLSFIFSNFALAEEAAEEDVRQIDCNSRAIKLKTNVESVKILSSQTSQETELYCLGQCSIDQWACVTVDGISYLWFRGTNAIRYAADSIDGHEYIGHWAIQLNEIDWNVRLKHRHLNDISKYFQILDKTRDEQIIYRSSSLDFEQTFHRSKNSKIARKKYPYISKIYDSTVFSMD